MSLISAAACGVALYAPLIGRFQLPAHYYVEASCSLSCAPTSRHRRWFAGKCQEMPRFLPQISLATNKICGILDENGAVPRSNFVISVITGAHYPSARCAICARRVTTVRKNTDCPCSCRRLDAASDIGRRPKSVRRLPDLKEKRPTHWTSCGCDH